MLNKYERKNNNNLFRKYARHVFMSQTKTVKQLHDQIT